MLGLLVRAPRTMAELSELTGMDRTALHWWLRLMTEEGLLRCEKVSRHHVYHWSANWIGCARLKTAPLPPPCA
jgi:DNA-binding IclR family transcriptional regulator